MSLSKINKSVVTVRRVHFTNSVFVNPGIYSCAVVACENSRPSSLPARVAFCVKNETPLGQGAKKDGYFRRLVLLMPFWKSLCICFFHVYQIYRPGARFSKAPKSFRARKAIFRSSVSKNGEVYTPETSCTKRTSLHL